MSSIYKERLSGKVENKITDNFQVALNYHMALRWAVISILNCSMIKILFNKYRNKCWLKTLRNVLIISKNAPKGPRTNNQH
jgi:hypothetical protein